MKNFISGKNKCNLRKFYYGNCFPIFNLNFKAFSKPHRYLKRMI